MSNEIPKDENNGGSVAADPLEIAEERSAEAWAKAKEDVSELADLGHEGEEAAPAKKEGEE